MMTACEAHGALLHYQCGEALSKPGQMRRLKVGIERRPDRASVEQREDSARLNTSLKEELTKKGLVFESVDPAAFRAALTKAGFYKEWRDKFGAEGWTALEAVVGPLS